MRYPKKLFEITFLLIIVLFTVWLLLPDHDHAHHEHAHDEHEDEIARGEHGGRLLTADGLELEILLDDGGAATEFHIYPYTTDGQPHRPLTDLDQLTVDIELHRTGNRVDHLQLSPWQDYLRSDKPVAEPHSFEVNINAVYNDQPYSWRYENFEGRTRIAAEMADVLGIRSEVAGPQTITQSRMLTGRVQTAPQRLSRVRPRFAGMVASVEVELGDRVRANDILATVQSNESLQNYPVRAPIDGVIVKRDLQVGENTGNDPLFIIADHSEVWVELDVFDRDRELVKKGQKVIIETLDGKNRVLSSIDWLSPLISHASQSIRARAIVGNRDVQLYPGQFIRARVIIAEHKVPLAVRPSALQRFGDVTVVFARFDDVYEVRILQLGKRNKEWVEVLGGLEPGTQYVTENSYLLKADIEKSHAGHHH